MRFKHFIAEGAITKKDMVEDMLFKSSKGEYRFKTKKGQFFYFDHGDDFVRFKFEEFLKIPGLKKVGVKPEKLPKISKAAASRIKRKTGKYMDKWERALR